MNAAARRLMHLQHGVDAERLAGQESVMAAIMARKRSDAVNAFYAVQHGSQKRFFCIVDPRLKRRMAPWLWITPEDLSYVAFFNKSKAVLQCDYIATTDTLRAKNAGAWMALMDVKEAHRDPFERVWGIEPRRAKPG